MLGSNLGIQTLYPDLIIRAITESLQICVRHHAPSEITITPSTLCPSTLAFDTIQPERPVVLLNKQLRNECVTLAICQ